VGVRGRDGRVGKGREEGKRGGRRGVGRERGEGLCWCVRVDSGWVARWCNVWGVLGEGWGEM